MTQAERAPEYSVVVSEVTKRYGDFVAVGDLSFNVPTGTIYGILGPNGAGKTTTLRMLNDILLPDQGEIRLLDNLKPGLQASQRIGYLPEERGLYPKMKVIDVLVFFGELRGLSKKKATAQARTWLERLRIADWHNNKVQDLSKGMQQKVQFSAALIHDPELLILDEPWSGLDPINADVLKDIVVAQKEAGRTVLFSTHQMDQAEQICDHVCIIARGKKALEGKLSTLKSDASGEGIVLLDFVEDAQKSRAQSEILPEFVCSEKKTKTGLEVALKSDCSEQSLLMALTSAGVQLQRFERKRPSLHQIFVDSVGEQADTQIANRGAAK